LNFTYIIRLFGVISQGFIGKTKVNVFDFDLNLIYECLFGQT